MYCNEIFNHCIKLLQGYFFVRRISATIFVHTKNLSKVKTFAAKFTICYKKILLKKKFPYMGIKYKWKKHFLTFLKNCPNMVIYHHKWSRNITAMKKIIGCFPPIKKIIPNNYCKKPMKNYSFHQKYHKK